MKLIERLRPFMADMATGSAGALFAFLDEFRPELEREVATILASLHRKDILRSQDEVGSLVVSAALVLFGRAHAWKPDGALPWAWAYRSIREEIVAQIGHPTVEFDGSRHELPPVVGHDRSQDIDLRDIATGNEVIAAWIQAVEEVANERDRDVHLEYQVQKHLKDPSPAMTVASMFALSPDNVRQIDRRVRKRLSTHPFGRSGEAFVITGIASS